MEKHAFSDGMPLGISGKKIAPYNTQIIRKNRLKGKRLKKLSSVSQNYNGSPNNEPENERKKYVNSLLIPDKKSVIYEKAFNLKDYKPYMLENTPGVYAFKCKVTNKFYFGESKNIKGRKSTHSYNLENGIHENRFFQMEYREYGKENFEFLLIKSGLAMDNVDDRLDIQGILQAHFIPLGLCYNFNFNELHHGTSRPGTFPSVAGLYCIRNTLNNACYFGETGSTKGLSIRITRWKQDLNKASNNVNIKTPNKKLQFDWDYYGKEAFEFIIMEQGAEWTKKFDRLERETDLINAHISAGFIVYNYSEIEKRVPFCNIADKDRILGNKKPEYKEYIKDITSERVSPFRKAVVAHGNVYLSIEEASVHINCTRRNIRQLIVSGTYRYATQDEIYQEKMRRSFPGNNPVLYNSERQSTGLPRPVIVDDIYYNSLSEAAAALGTSIPNVEQSILRGRVGWRYADSPAVIPRAPQTGRKRRVVANGKEYESISAAARALNQKPPSVRNKVERGIEGYYFPDDERKPPE